MDFSNGTCPATTHRMSRVQAALSQQTCLKTPRVGLFSITLDLIRDTREKLQGYMRLYDVLSTSWSFLTSTQDPVASTIAAWGMGPGRLPMDSWTIRRVSSWLMARAQIREIYFLKTSWIVEDIKLLLGEAPRE